MGNFNPPDMWWQGNTAWHSPSGFLRLPGITPQHQHCTSWAGVMTRRLLLFTRQEQEVVDVAIDSSLGCSYHQITEFGFLRGSDEGKELTACRPWISGLTGSFREIVGRTPWEVALKVHENEQVTQDNLLPMKDCPSPNSGRRVGDQLS